MRLVVVKCGFTCSVHPLDLGWELELWVLALLCQPGQPDQGLGTGTADTDRGPHRTGIGGDPGWYY